MAAVQWLQELPDKNHFGVPYEVWPRSLFGPASFIPINRIKNQVIVCPHVVNDENVFVVSPLKRSMFL